MQSRPAIRTDDFDVSQYRSIACKGRYRNTASIDIGCQKWDIFDIRCISHRRVRAKPARGFAPGSSCVLRMIRQCGLLLPPPKECDRTGM